MAKVVEMLSPEKYIKTKARGLKIHQCFVSSNWKTNGMCNVYVIRIHNNGNYTIGVYLVDLYCLGIKDASYMFNYKQFDYDEFLENVKKNEDLEEIDYNLAHNIVYAGHDFAADYEIKPHKDFEIAQYILEEDNDDIPLMDIEVGDNGIPHLITYNKNQHLNALQKLKDIAGEGNYLYTVLGADMMGDNYLTSDEYQQNFEEDDFESIGLEDIDEFEIGTLNYSDMQVIDWKNKENLIKIKARDKHEQIFIGLYLNLKVYQDSFWGDERFLEDEIHESDDIDFMEEAYHTLIDEELKHLGNYSTNLPQGEDKIYNYTYTFFEKNNPSILEAILIYDIVCSLTEDLSNLTKFESFMEAKYDSSNQLFITALGAAHAKLGNMNDSYVEKVLKLNIQDLCKKIDEYTAFSLYYFYIGKSHISLKNNDTENAVKSFLRASFFEITYTSFLLLTEKLLKHINEVNES